MDEQLSNASSRVALAAYLHDLGKLAERAKVFKDDPRLNAHLQLYCPFHNDGGWFSHRHAAFTALAFETIEPYLPDVLHGEVAPFVGRADVGDNAANATDSLVNAAAAHHKPSTFLQWIIATADRVASGFERETFEQYNQAGEKRKRGINHYTARQLTLFEQIRLSNPSIITEDALKYRFTLRPLAPANLLPVPASECEKPDEDLACKEYEALWHGFIEGIKQIPAAHRDNLSLWLDHFDSLWLTWTQAIPSATAFGVRPEVSLYDHSRTTAALAVALWRWHDAKQQTDDTAAKRLKSREDFSSEKILLIQGDFFGIQDFVFTSGGDTRKNAAKLLRGRSFQVSLFTELAALRILEALGLPPTSQVVNAAGKFLIVAPNTADTLEKLKQTRDQINDWFLEQTFGLAGIGLAWTGACCNDFLTGVEHGGFSRLMRTLIEELDVEKHRRFDLCQSGGQVFSEATFPLGPCAYNGRLPADRAGSDLQAASCALSRDQIAIGNALAHQQCMLIVDADSASAKTQKKLEQDYFGYTVLFSRLEDIRAQTVAAVQGQLRRCWDYSPPSPNDTHGTQPLWEGVARRFISGHMPVVTEHDLQNSERYIGVASDEIPEQGDLKPFDMIACEDRICTDGTERHWVGKAALGVLKGDVDDLGEIFRVGLSKPTFAKYASLSRQINAFFSIWLPWHLSQKHPDSYTVFAGGDDFFLIAPWRTAQVVAADMRNAFKAYVADNPEIHFSAGISTHKTGAPVQTFAEQAEHALELAKHNNHGYKNALTCFDVPVPWDKWAAIEGAGESLTDLRKDFSLSTGFVYSLLQLLDLAVRENDGKEPDAAIWRAHLAYRARRFANTQVRGDHERQQGIATRLVNDIGSQGIGLLRSHYRIALYNHLYQFRDR